ncbi:MAG: Ig-like domain-containing protein [Dehalococcoidia bacterium]
MRHEGDTNFNADADTATVTITANTTTTSITRSSAGAKNFGETITFSANVTSAVNPPPGSGDGQVQFLYNTGGTDVLIATASKTGSSWTTSTTTLGVGSYNVRKVRPHSGGILAEPVDDGGDHGERIVYDNDDDLTGQCKPTLGEHHLDGNRFADDGEWDQTFYQAGERADRYSRQRRSLEERRPPIAPAPASMPASGTAHTRCSRRFPRQTRTCEFAITESHNDDYSGKATSTALSASPNPVVSGSAR